MVPYEEGRGQIGRWVLRGGGGLLGVEKAEVGGVEGDDPRSRLNFPRAKLRRQIFMTGRRIGRRIGRNFGRIFLGVFVLHLLCRKTHQIFSPNSSQFITPCLVTAPVTEISKFHLRELLGLGAPKRLQLEQKSLHTQLLLLGN